MIHYKKHWKKLNEENRKAETETVAPSPQDVRRSSHFQMVLKMNKIIKKKQKRFLFFFQNEQKVKKGDCNLEGKIDLKTKFKIRYFKSWQFRSAFDLGLFFHHFDSLLFLHQLVLLLQEHMDNINSQ